jgi:hypothetical protein
MARGRREAGPLRIAMHYHVVLTVDGQENFTGTFDTWEYAEQAAEALSRAPDAWVPRRYPGRSWRAGEVAVYLDRRAWRRVTRQELTIIRCLVDGREPGPACQVRGPSSTPRVPGMTHAMAASLPHSTVR